jgi:hypothetical protein
MKNVCPRFNFRSNAVRGKINNLCYIQIHRETEVARRQKVPRLIIHKVSHNITL